jgi:midasin (ATPase involved in ribosome maturation)
MSQFTFQQKSTNALSLLSLSIPLLKEQRRGGKETLQLMIIISDGILSERESVRKWVREAEEERILLVMIILDSHKEKDSILNMQSVTFEGLSISLFLHASSLFFSLSLSRIYFE